MSRNLVLAIISLCSFLGACTASAAKPSGYDGRYGLTRPQPSEELPKAACPPQTARPKARKPLQRICPAPAGNQLWQLSDGWVLAECDNVERGGCGSLFSYDYDCPGWTDAVVPGTVLTSLVEAGVYPDPYYGLNNLAIPDSLCRRQWWYRLAFERPKAETCHRALLRFDGINYRADVWLNSVKLGSINGAFSRGVFDVTHILAEHNVLAVKIYPPANPGIPHEQSARSGQGHNGGVLCLDGPTFISSEGWDWIPGIRDRNIGIWQPVTLRYIGDVAIGDTQIVTDLPLPSTDHADLKLSTRLKNLSDRPADVCLCANLEGRRLFELPLTLAPHEERPVNLSPADFTALRVENPRLWWPNGYGPQELYDLRLEVIQADATSDCRDLRFGIREYSYILSADDPEGRELRFEFQPTDDLGESYPFDSSQRRPAADGGVVLPRLRDGFTPAPERLISGDATAPYLVLCCNGVRIFCRGGNWGMDDGMKRVSRCRLEPALRLHKEQGFNMIRNWTGETTEELFYTLCDEYGMMVWNDFWLSTEGANLEPADEDLFVANATETVRRFRNHPSIAIWCPRNEGYAPASLDRRLSDMIAREDGTRYYSPNSRYMNLRTSGPWHYLIDQSEYLYRHARGFSTELGSPSLPTAESMRKFIPESEQWPISDTWHYHDLHSGLPHYCNTIDSLYGPSASLDDFCRKAQMINYSSYRTMFEAWNANMWHSTSGMLLWMSHPAWPSVEWQTYSWDFETAGAYFGSKKACEPLHIQLADSSVCVVNSSREPLGKGFALISHINSEGKVIASEKVHFSSIPANGVSDLGYSLSAKYEPLILRLELYSKGRRLSVNDYLPEKRLRLTHLNGLAPAALSLKSIKNTGEGLSFEIRNASTVPAIGVKFNIRKAATGEAVLPAYFSDGYINLLPGESRTITVAFDCPDPTALSAEGYNLPATIISNL